MTLSLPLPRNTPRNLSAIGLALVWTGLTFGAAISPAPVEARTAVPYYTVELAAPASEARSIIGGVVFQCSGTECLAGKASSRPEVMCKRVAREFGEVTKFAANGEELQADKLAACNTK